MRILPTLFLLLFFATTAHSRPVSFVGGKTIIVNHDEKETSSLVHYTLTPKTSIGLKTIFRDDFRSTIDAIEINHLLHRDNGENHQANFYLKSGIGLASLNIGGFRNSIDPVGYVGFATDWEDRKFFVSYENKYEAISGNGSDFSQSARVGFAPYVAEYGELHTWLMLELNHHPDDQQGDFTIRPLVRFFKGVHLLEVGMNDRMEAMVNWIGRF